MAKNSPEALATQLEAKAIRDQEKFLERVKSAESLCKKDPPVYQGIVAMLAMLGYAYIFAFLGFFLWAIFALVHGISTGEMAGFISVKLLVALVVFAWIIIKALIVKIPTPKGTKLDRHDAPQLFAVLDKLKEQLSVRIDEVIATPDLNACIVQIPRLGMLGWYKNYLVLGLPLLYGNTTEQFTAIVAHEMGHISGSHGETGSWIYSLSQSWRALLTDMRRNGLTFYLFYPFFNWYYPYFLAYASVLNRQHEHEADRLAVQLTSARTMAESLISLELRSRFLSDRFSKSVTDQMLQLPAPPENMYVDMAHQMQCPDIDFDEAERWYLQALNRPTDPHDTHPALTDRLTDIGYPADDVEKLRTAKVPFRDLLAIGHNAAEALLGGKAEQMLKSMSTSWYDSVKEAWSREYTSATKQREELETLETKSQQEKLSAAELLKLGHLTHRLKGSEAAIPIYRQFLEEQPTDAACNYALGSALLEIENEEGIERLEKAMEGGLQYALAGCALATDFYQKRHEMDKVSIWKRLALKHNANFAALSQERSVITERDEFQPQDLEAAQVAELSEWVSKFPEIAAAYLIKRKLKSMPEYPQYILGLEQTQWRLMSETRMRDISIELQKRLYDYPVDVIVIHLAGNFAAAGKKIKSIPGSKIYPQK